MPRRLDTFLRGPHLRLPRPVDAVSEQWSRLAPRLRMIVGTLLLMAVLLALDARVRTIDARWGGAPRDVLVATADLTVGDNAERVRRVKLPPAAVPPRALDQVGPQEVLALAAPRGTVLTQAHVGRRGPTSGLPPGQRAVPVPTEPGWGIVAGGWVDVWVLGTGEEPAELVAASRPVLQLREDGAGLTSLVGLEGPEVEAVTTGLALGRILLAHAPAPGGRETID